MRGVKFMKSGQICEIHVTEVKVVKLIKCMKMKYNKQNITGNDIRGHQGHACMFLLLQNYGSG